MIFSHGLDDKVRDGTKTQTKRLVKRGNDLVHWPTTRRELELGMRPRRNSVPCLYRRKKAYRDLPFGGDYLLYRETQTYAIQSGRGKKANGRFRITKIRKETLQSITDADAIAEGVSKIMSNDAEWWTNEATVSFKQLWNSIHKKKGTRWEDNPEVWVLEIENVGSNR